MGDTVPKITESPLVYLRNQLKFQLGEWTALSDTDKARLKDWAIEEIANINAQVA